MFPRSFCLSEIPRVYGRVYGSVPINLFFKFVGTDT